MGAANLSPQSKTQKPPGKINLSNGFSSGDRVVCELCGEGEGLVETFAVSRGGSRGCWRGNDV